MGRRRPLLALVQIGIVVVSCLTVRVAARLADDPPMLQVDTAYVLQDSNVPGWTIGNELIRYSIGQQGSSIAVRAIVDVVSGRDWHQTDAPDAFVTVNGSRIDVGSSVTTFVGAKASPSWGGVRLDLTYRVASLSLDIVRSYACYPGSSVIEAWTTFANTGSKPMTLSDLTTLALVVKPGRLRSLRGLQSSADTGGSFTLQAASLDNGQTFDIGSGTRSSETSAPWFAIRADVPEGEDPATWEPEFFGSILWGGAWRFHADRGSDRIALQIGLPPFGTSVGPGGVLETPHAIIGLTNSVVPEESLALRRFINLGIRHGRPLRADVTYNTWFTYGTFINEASLEAEMDLAAEMGIEQFVVDAGWWPGINPDDPGDFSRGLGGWDADPERFPNGLRALSDYAHSLGMRFGIWVEPERVDLALVDRKLVDERFLATSNGFYEPGLSNSEASYAQVCLASEDARRWLTGRLHAFIDEVRPDYLKWDNNFWINCDRPSHGHGAEDGNFRHFQGLLSVLDELRKSYPDLDIENCANGGNRLSLGMLAYSDVGWIDDRSSPSEHVRHNLGGLSVLLPASYMFTFIMGDATEPLTSPDTDLLRLIRSRMGGMLGAAWSGRRLSDGRKGVMADEIGLYKQIRPIFQDGATFLLGSQVVDYPDVPWLGWDAIEHVQPSTGDAVVLAFSTDDAAGSAIVKPRALKPEATYDVESADAGPIGEATGAGLMEQGIEISSTDGSHSHVLTLRVRSAPARFFSRRPFLFQ